MIAAARRAIDRFRSSRVGGTLKRYSNAHGNVLAGGIAYHALMSVAAGVVVLSTVAALAVARIPGLKDALLRFLDRAIPGAVGDARDGLIDGESLTAGAITGVVSLVALIVAAYTATRYVGALRTATQTMLGTDSRSAVRGKAQDAVALAALAFTAVTAAGVQVLAAGISRWLTDSADARTVALRVAALAVTLVADTAFVTIAIVVLGRKRGPWREVFSVILVAAGVIGALRFGSSLVLASAISNPVLAPFAAVVALIVWVDILSRVVLLASAWLGCAVETTPPAS